MGAYQGVSEFIGKDLAKVAKEMKYQEDNILILNGELDTLKSKYPQTFQNIISCQHHADKRSPLQYARDLVSSWIMEDYFFNILKSESYNITLSGADQNRTILSNTKTSSSSDYLISQSSKKIKLELMNDYTGFWEKTKKFHLRDFKYNNLYNEQAVLLGVSVPTNKFFLYDFNDNINAKKIDSHRPYGGKSAYEIEIGNGDLKEFNVDNLQKEIVTILERR